MAGTKVPWRGLVTSVQPRIFLTRSSDERSHTYQGYVLRLNGTIDDVDRPFIVAIGAGAYAKHQFRVGDTVGALPYLTGRRARNPGTCRFPSRRTSPPW